MNPLIAIALSGGVDSMMAAAFLKEQGHRVLGIHFLTGYQSGFAARGARPAIDLPGGADPPGIRQVAAQLDIPLEIYDCSGAFQAGVVDYFTRTYQAGRTPNPCLVCNPTIKFGVVLAHARKLGATRLATGHYARRIQDTAGRFHLHRGIDPLKDQSYFLARLTQAQLTEACFPLGAMTKSEVVAAARRRGLSPVSRQESQDVCFIPEGRYGPFLAAQGGFHAVPGPIEDLHGNTLGKHPGTHLFTVGQRRGINCPAAEPYYVLRIDPDRNRLVVGRKENLLSRECRVEEINWLVDSPATGTKVHTRLRYHHRAAPSTLVPDGETSAIVRFEAPQEAIAPGQGAVFYHGEEVIGGGWIQRAAA
jgi:tRNA-specific 2-thiouridylase